LSEEKGFQTIIEALARIKKLETKLYIVGQGEYEKTLKELVKTFGLQEKVIFLGFKTGAELHKLVREAMFVVVPSLWYENSPLTIYESLALGTPVIGAATGGIPELIDEQSDLEKSTGVTFTPGDAADLADKISFFLENSEILPAMGQNARKFFEENFTIEKYYDNFVRLLELLPARDLEPVQEETELSPETGPLLVRK